jgi:hypothetical protein
MKKIFCLLLPVIVALTGFTQNRQPSDFQGTLTLEDNKVIPFSYLENPGFGTRFTWFANIPSSEEFQKDQNGNSLSFSQIRKIEFIGFTPQETELLKYKCPDCFLRKARIVADPGKTEIPGQVYLVLRQLNWKSPEMKDLDTVRSMEARFIDELEISLKMK